MENIIHCNQHGVCSICKKNTQIVAFFLFKRTGVYLCDQCLALYHGENNPPTPPTNKNHHATKGQREKMYFLQNGVCAICGKKETAKGPTGTVIPLSVDHDHVTGKIRALLCRKCNTALGMLEDNPERCEALAQYIRKHR